MVFHYNKYGRELTMPADGHLRWRPTVWLSYNVSLYIEGLVRARLLVSAKNGNSIADELELP